MTLLRTVVLSMALLALGCQQEKQVTHEAAPGARLHVLGSEPIELPTPQAISAERQRQIEEMVNRILSAPRMDERVAAAIGASDASAESLRQSIEALDGAEEIVLYNVRNADTIGFKGSRCLRNGDSYVVRLDMRKGRLDETDRALDVAIEGDGFFAVKAPNGLAYTRNGSLSISNRGELALGMNGILPLDPPITVPKSAGQLEIDFDGSIFALFPGQSEKRSIGTLQLVRFANPEDLNRLNETLFLQTEASGPPQPSQPGQNGTGKIFQGYLESSNVDLVRERLRLRFIDQWRAAVEQALQARR